MNDADVLQRIADQGLELPPPTKPVAAYVPVVVSGTAGLRRRAGADHRRAGPASRAARRRRFGGTGHEGWRRAALQALSALRAELGSFDRLRASPQVTVYIASTPDFAAAPAGGERRERPAGRCAGRGGQACPRRDRDGVAPARRLHRGGGDGRGDPELGRFAAGALGGKRTSPSRRVTPR